MNRIFLWLSLTMAPFLCEAKERTLTGRVVETISKKPIGDVRITIDETELTTTTNHLGYFSLTIDDKKHRIMSASHISYGLKRFEIPSVDKFQFTLDVKPLRLPDIQLEQASSTAPDGMQTAQTTNGDRNAFFGTTPDAFKNYVLAGLKNASLTNLKRIVVRFQVDASGKVARVLQSDTTDAARKSVVQNLFLEMKEWQPAMQGGKPVSQELEVQIVQRMADQASLSTFYRYLGEKIQYPLTARSRGLQGPVDVAFTVSPEGKATDIRVTRDVNNGFGAELKRVLSKAPPDTLLALVNATGSESFILPLAFGMNVAYVRDPPSSFSDRYVLAEIVVTAKFR